MKDEIVKIEKLEDIIDREMERHPHSQPLLQAFRHVILARNRILEGLQLAESEPLVLDDIRFQGGVPVIAQYPLIREDDPWKDIVQAMIPAVQEGFPDLREDLDRLGNALQADDFDLYDYFRRNSEEQQDLLSIWAGTISIAAERIGFILNQASRIVLEKRAGDIAEQIEALHWEKGYCPICGSFPSLAVIGEKIGERRLHCSRCGHNWRFSRVICPYCEREAQQEMNFFYIEDKPQESAFTCEECQRYLITLNRVSDLNDRDLDVSALGLTHLDIILQEKHFVPMTVTDWNVF
ncbi:formate dehydrogenase accessory protein FdhE [Syntrophus aciditrophicus]|uniref:Protein involved in formate dehydrogenase formation n=1 Tax=Syntrophus aciditrophicus (strain SB) TaxID=56780 RepID=Q2LQE2_SYNAS|nr:formate dehydrogenase accessory protein FdhE [Syntrophus aciditrophicus]ABC76027.1 protein involved in formate dehydrogenase formation [Syntrophus aciditrophicus SB]